MTAMRDLVFVLLTLAFFAVSWWYVRAADRLEGRKRSS
jgi:hypothetical protein